MSPEQLGRSIDYQRDLAGAYIRLDLDALCARYGLPAIHRDHDWPDQLPSRQRGEGSLSKRASDCT